MASVLAPSGITLLPEDIKAFNDVIFKGVFAKPQLSQYHAIRKGIVGRTRIAVVGGFSGLLGSVQASEAVVIDSGSIPTTEKEWTPKYHSGRVEQGYIGMMNTYLQWGLGMGYSKEDLNNAPLLIAFLDMIFSDALAESILRGSYFNDTAAVAGTGNNISAPNLKYFTSIDGIFKQLAAMVAADSTKGVTIAKNAGIDIAAQRFTAADVTNQVITNNFQTAIDNADYRLKDITNDKKVFLVTDSVYRQYMRERKLATGITMAYQRVEQGIPSVEFDGIPVVPMNIWDRTLNAFFQVTSSGNTSIVNPHRFILTPHTSVENIVIGTSDDKYFSELFPFYDPVSKKYLIDYGYDIDAKVLLSEMVMYGA